MDFLRWLKSKTFAPAIIADNATTQYHKWKSFTEQYTMAKAMAKTMGASPEVLEPAVIYMLEKYGEIGESPTDIVRYMWDLRYDRAPLDKNSTQRYAHYLSADFPIETVMDFCLSSSDIEFCVSPSDADYTTYQDVAKHIGKHLTDNNVPYVAGDIDLFRNKWDRLIKPAR